MLNMLWKLLVALGMCIYVQSFLIFGGKSQVGLYSRLNKLFSSQQQDHSALVFPTLIDKLKGTNIYLVGLMGSGKTTIGQKLSQELNFKHLDSDELAEWMIEMPIPQFFAEYGEDQFREVETTVLNEVCQYTGLVVSTGGGAVLKNENWGLLRHGIVVFLDPSVHVIAERLQSKPEYIQSRPLLKDAGNIKDKLEELRNQREEKYLQADVRVILPETSSIEECTKLIAQAVIDHIDSNPPQWKKTGPPGIADVIATSSAGSSSNTN